MALYDGILTRAYSLDVKCAVPCCTVVQVQTVVEGDMLCEYRVGTRLDLKVKCNPRILFFNMRRNNMIYGRVPGTIF